MLADRHRRVGAPQGKKTRQFAGPKEGGAVADGCPLDELSGQPRPLKRKKVEYGAKLWKKSLVLA